MEITEGLSHVTTIWISGTLN